MTQEQYNKLNNYRQSLEDIVVHNSMPNGSNQVLRDIDSIYHEIFPTAAPTNFSCAACVFDMITTSRNALLNHTPEEKKTFKILLVAHRKTGGVEYHRMIKPNSVLKRFHDEYHFTKIDAIHPTEDIDGRQVIIHNDEKVEVAFKINDDYLKQFDLIHFCRGIAMKDMTEGVAQRLNRLGIPFGIDLDDYWELPKDHILYPNYLEHDITKNILDGIKYAHFVTCTTPILANYIKYLNPNVHVIENGIDIQDESWQPDVSKTDKMRFGFMQGATHLNEMKWVGPYIQNVFNDRRLKNYQIVIGGFNGEPGKSSSYIAYEKYITDGLKCLKQYPNFQKYLYSCTEANNELFDSFPYRRVWAQPANTFGNSYNEIDVSLIPLFDTQFNSCKSELKMIEAGIKGKAAIVSKVKPYTLLATNENSFQVDTTYSFYTQIRYCLNNPNAVEDKAAKLKEDVTKKHSLQALTLKRKQVYDYYIKK